MKILVISDVHGRRDAVERVLTRHPDAATVLFLGDGLREVEDVADCHPARTFIMVPGNCDFSATLPAARLEILGGKRFFITHCHKYNVKYGLYTIEMAARERQAAIVLFGHRVERQIRTRLKAVYFGAFRPNRSRKATALLHPIETEIPQNLLAFRS